VKYQAIEFVVEQSEKAEQMTTSPLLTGGAGFDFEDSVAAVYLTALLLGVNPLDGTNYLDTLGSPKIQDARVTRQREFN
jgi:hypothetical protein